MASSEDLSAQPAVRASDADRERTATLLREHTGAGRLTPEELAERLDAAYAARTVAELSVLVEDLPAAPAPAPAGAPGARERTLHLIGIAVLANLAANAIWLATGTGGDWWPKWVLLATAIRLAFRVWGVLGPAAGHEEARRGRGGARRLER